MSPRRTRLALLVALGLTAITLPAVTLISARDLATFGTSWGRTRNAPLSIGAGSADGLVTQALERDRRDLDAARTPSYRLGLLAVVASAVSMVSAARRGRALSDVALETSSLFRSPHRGRAPPLPLASIV